MITNIKSSYIHCDHSHCHQEYFSSFYIKDVENSKCETLLSPIGATCCIENSNTDLIDFLCIDKCLIDSNELMKCDCLVIKGNIIWFIELKEVVFSGDRKKDIKRKNKGRKKAVKQLASTINDFKAKGVDLSDKLVAALICFPPYIDETNPITIPTTTSQVQILNFSNLCGYTEIFEGNHLVL